MFRLVIIYVGLIGMIVKVSSSEVKVIIGVRVKIM